VISGSPNLLLAGEFQGKFDAIERSCIASMSEVSNRSNFGIASL
jgi:hypothetical protein